MLGPVKKGGVLVNYLFDIIEVDSLGQIKIPRYSGKQMVSGLRLIFSSNRSFLFKKRMIEVSTNHFELQMESKSFIDSIIRFISSSSARTRSYPVNN